MPEGPEVYKLVYSLAHAWQGRRIVKFTAPASSPSPRKYAVDGWEKFSAAVRAEMITVVQQYGKAIVVRFVNVPSWYIALMSTGWFLPGNPLTYMAAGGDKNYHQHFHAEFLHAMGPIRVRLLLDDGQVWHYHDSRTWGRWRILTTNRTPRLDPWFANHGPDIISNPLGIQDVLMKVKSKATTKAVLCDQTVIAGVGNYMSCEVCFTAGVHPHRPWNTLSLHDVVKIDHAVRRLSEQAISARDHSHWNVFDRAGEPCKQCATPVSYVKDKGGARGSYYCSECQGTPTTPPMASLDNGTATSS